MASRSSSLDMSQEKIIEVEISMEPKYHGYFFANRRALLNQISMECGGVEIWFPRATFDSDSVIIKGTLECINAAKKRMRQCILDLESSVTVECEIPRRHRFAVLGSKGSNVQKIGAEFNVRIKFPERFPQVWHSGRKCDDNGMEVMETAPTYDVVRIRGKQHNAEAAKQALLSLVPITIKPHVPQYLHRAIIGERGSDISEFRQKFDVSIVVPRAEEKLDYITITGLPPRVEKAKEAILQRCEILEVQQEERKSQISFELKMEVDSDYHPKIVSHSGKGIHEIIADHDVAINFPCIGDPEENIITISGSEENVHNARDDIMKIINKLEQEDTMLPDQVPKTQNERTDTSPCESPTQSIETKTIVHKDTDIEDLSNVKTKSSDAKYDVKKESPKAEVQKLLPAIQTLYEKLKISRNSIPISEECTKAATNSQEDLGEFFSNLLLTQEKKIIELSSQLNDQVSANKALKVERTRLILEINSEQQKCERMIYANHEKCDTEIAKISESMKDIETKFNSEREEKLKIEAENTERLKRFEELDLKYQALEVTSTYYENHMEVLKSRIQELEGKLDASQNSKLNLLE